jgi:serine/threonine protein kinase
MIAARTFESGLLSLSQLQLVVSAGDRYEAAWKAGSNPSIEPFLEEVEPEARPHLFRTLLELELELRKLGGEPALLADYSSRFAEFSEIVKTVFAQRDNPTLATGVNSETTSDSNWANQWVPGQVINGYELVDRIGQGGMGTVFKARQRSAGGRLVALKVVRPDLLNQHSESVKSELLSRFRAEVKAIASIEHDYIVPLYEAGEADGLPYYAMRFVDGSNLAQVLEQGPISGPRAAELLEPIVRAVAHLHERKVIHRDIKPRNLILDSNGRLLLTDFGLAKQLEALSVDATLSNPMIGTPAYMSPEQACGTARVGPAADIYSLGATLYEMLTGKAPFRGTTPLEVLQQVLNDDPTPPDRINNEVETGMVRICLKCLLKEPGRRYPTASALAEDLARYRAGKTPHARPPGSLYQARRWSKRRPVIAALGLALLIAIPSGVLGIHWLEGRTLALRTNDLVRNLLTVKTEGLLNAIDEVRGSRRPVAEKLHENWSSSTSEPGDKLRATLALLRLDEQHSPPELIDYLLGELESLDASTLGVACAVLQSRQVDVGPRLWKILHNQQEVSGHRLRAACLLAKWDANNGAWDGVASDVALELLSTNSAEMEGWTQLLRPVAGRLKPFLLEQFKDRRRPDTGQRAAAILAAQFAGNAEILAELVASAESDQLRVLAQTLLVDRNASKLALMTGLSGCMGNKPGADFEAHFKRVANLAAVLLRLEWSEDQAQLLRRKDDVDILVRSLLIPRLEQAGVELDVLTAAFERELDISGRVALLLAMGEYSFNSLPPSQREQFRARLLELFHTDPDATIHSASEWLLPLWGIEASEPAASANSATIPGDRKKRWEINKNRHTMILFPDATEGEIGALGVIASAGTAIPLQRVRLAPFAIASKETTRAQLLALCPEAKVVASDEPVSEIDFVMAARYCNKLSELEGIPKEHWFYVNSRNGYDIGPGPDLNHRYGYRVPTEEEWEYACRANCGDIWFCGRSREVLQRYAWFLENAGERATPVGKLRPNDFGLFDVIGNVEEWCICGNGQKKASVQALRGGAANFASIQFHTEDRITSMPTIRGILRGFRVARTLPPAK